jgi:hydrogenase expression/formation protein HypD
MPEQQSDASVILYDPGTVADFVASIKRNAPIEGRLNIMEVCGTHTWAISRHGLRSLLAGTVNFISGPGCPVCVTDQSDIDWAVNAAEAGVVLHVPGDMLRVPGTERSLMISRSLGARVNVVYSPRDAIKTIQAEPEREHVYFGVGFETTTPAIALMLKKSIELGLRNFSLYLVAKTMPQILAVVLSDSDSLIDGLILPGHVSAVTGSDGFGFVAQHGMPAVIAGFAPADVAYATDELVKMIRSGRHEVVNCYERLVTPQGMPPARALVSEYFEPADAIWRGFGMVPLSGLAIRQQYSAFDARIRHRIPTAPPAKPTGCRCADVIMGRIHPEECGLFDSVCSPSSPIGPCMVSSEGACAAHYTYDRDQEA